MQFSLVSTVFNEILRLEKTIVDIENQSCKPSEIIITDAGSTDGTYESLLKWKSESIIPISILREKACNIARGRNLAIQNACYKLIVSTDFGCRFHPKWLESLIIPFQSKTDIQNSEIQVAGGTFTIREEEIETMAAKADYILQRGYEVVMDEYFSVSSRSIAFYKEVWESVGGYPEWLTLAADDTIFWRLVKKAGYNYTLVDKPFVYWGRHKTHKAFAREAFRYGLGDGESRINFRNFWSNLIETIMRYLLFASVLLILFTLLLSNENSFIPSMIWFIPLFFLLGLRSYLFTWKQWMKLKSEKYNFIAFLNAIWQLEISRVQYLKGYTFGILDRDELKKEGRLLIWKMLR